MDRIKGVPFRLSLLSACIASVICSNSYAGTVKSSIEYQQFRDFAENKGLFTAGSTNIPVKDINGNVIGTMMSNVSMPNLNSLSTSGVATLVNPQYVVSVLHNQGYGDVSFGYKNKLPSYTYRIVDRNNFVEVRQKSDDDFHAPRLNKLVTEVEPTPINHINNTASSYQNTSRFSAYARVGAGTQNTLDSANNKKMVSAAYNYLTGGTISNFSNLYTTDGIIYTNQSLDSTFGKMVVLPEGGDSGSPLFAYDSQQKRWGLIGVLRGMTAETYFYVIAKPDFIQNKIQEDLVTLNNTRLNNALTWTPQGTSSTIAGTGVQLKVDLKDTNTASDSEATLLSFNRGKSIKFTGQQGVLSLANNINQGAGALEFQTNYTVKGANDNISWLGAGVTVAENKTVNWQIKNPEGDRLSKLGKGTLNVNGSGVNLGDISVGDGKVILAQTANANGQKQAFNKVEIVSGRPIVVLNDSEQVKPDNISFGYKGGRLDLNGNNLTFSTINNQDDGARIVNHNSQKTANLIIKGNNNVNLNLIWGNWGKAGADIYEYVNTHAGNRTDYFTLKPNGNPTTYYPINQTSNEHWTFLGSNKEEATKSVTLDKMSTLLTWGAWGNKGADIYEYINTYAGNRTDYFKLKPNGNPTTYYPINQTSNEHWEYIGSDKFSAAKQVFIDKAAQTLNWGQWSKKGSDIYEYINTHANNRTDYFILKPNGNPTTYYPINQTSNEHWEYIGSDKSEAILKAVEYKDIANITWGQWGKSGGDIYEYINTHAGNRKDYFILKGNAGAYYPINQTSNQHWEYIGSDKNDVIQTYLKRLYAEKSYFTFDGYLGETDPKYQNGKLNFSYIPNNSNNYFILTGGSALNGTFDVDNGNVILSGRPVPHAYDVVNNRDVVIDTDWINRSFSATKFSVKNDGALYFGRNAINVTGNFEARNNGKIHLGFIPSVTPICQRSDYTGITSCNIKQVNNDVFDSIPYLQAKGNVALYDNALFSIGKANLSGSIQASKNSTVKLSQFSNWNMTGNSVLGNLTLSGGSNIYLNTATNNTQQNYNELVINGNLEGQGRFHLLTNAFAQKGDHVTVNGLARGNFSFAINNTGAEPNVSSPLSLLKLNNPNQLASDVSASLDNGYVDLGTYRYILANINNDYRLYSPLRDAELSNQTQEYRQEKLAQIVEAEAKAQSFTTEISRLNTELQNQLVAQKLAGTNLANAQKKEQEQQAYLNGLTRASFTQLARERQKLTNLQQQVNSYKTSSQEISNAIATLNQSISNVTAQKNSVQSSIDETQQAMMNNIFKQAEALCLKTNSQAICNAVITEMSADERDFVSENNDGLTVEQDNTESVPAENEQKITTSPVTQREGVSRYSNTALSEISSQVNNLLQVARNSDREILAYRKEPLSVWTNADYQRTQYGSDNYRDYRQNSTLTQLGIEGELTRAIHLGAILSNTNVNNEFDQAHGDSKLKMATIYAKAQSENGWIATLEASYGKSKNSLNVGGLESKFNRNINVFGINLAKRWEYSGWEAKPYIGTKYYRLSGVNYNLDGADVSVKPLHLVTYQAGLKVAKRIEIGNAIFSPSFSTEYIDASRNALKVNSIEVNGNSLEQYFARHFKHELGLNTQFKNWEMGTYLGLLKGNEMKKQRYISFKLAYNW